MNRTTVTTPELKTGDRIAHYGAILEITEIRQTNHEVDANGPTFASKARVIETGNVIPLQWFDTDADGNRTWTVQGNRLATWERIEGEAQ